MPERVIIADTGPLVALLHHEQPHHQWSAQQVRELPAPLLTCEAVLTETAHFLRRLPGGIESLFQLLERGIAVVDFSLSAERVAVHALMRKYQDLPMSLADACLVRMAELQTDAEVLTLDTHFMIYRKHGRQRIATITPGS